MSEQKYKNLVFEGGAVLGVAYLGMLNVLDSKGILPNIEKVAGASAGAITALVTCFNLSASETGNIAATLDYAEVPEPGKPSKTEKELIILFKLLGVDLSFKDLNCLIRLIKHNGWYSSDYFYSWLKTTIDNQFLTNKKDAYTFADFHNQKNNNETAFKELSVIVSNMSTHSSEIFSYATTPDVEVAKAVQMSMSIPLFFESQDFQHPGCDSINTYSDGGTMWNYPLGIFDGPSGPNFETLGGRFNEALISPTVGPIDNLLDYIKSLALTLHAVQANYYNNTPDDAPRTIGIDVSGIDGLDGGLNFNIKPGGPIYDALIARGTKATNEFFNQ
ncbi:MAG: patatin [SAR86 cluster bacterium]|uniref:Patatin n=1 Tax=SAR86 cluster bacterium TaxID=2030880 RepID=A0A2A4WZM0_9GAMM|nr:MAG: patatin [SAR86 cluster bacterium]